MKYKNYYKILGLKDDKTSIEEVKAAYRKLAKEFHPDINKNNDLASSKFKDINEAYQVLGDEVARKKYDRIHFAYKIKNGFNFSDAKEKINTDNGFSEFFNMFFGKREQGNVSTNLDKNLNKKIPIQGEDLESEIEATLEETFFGGEKKVAFRTTDGKMKTISVRIPQGIRDGEKIRLASQGKPGINGGENGDLYIRIKIIKHNKFKLEGSNLVTEIPITPWEAALGCKLEIENIDSNILITVPAGIQSGERLRIANNGYKNGYGGRGDLLAEIKIVVPKELTEEERNLFHKFNEVSKFFPRGN
jgi:curved DNA-binding protein